MAISDFRKFIARALRRFGGADDGNVALLLGIMILPVTLTVGAAIDYRRAEAERSRLQGIADAASLAASDALRRGEDPNAVAVKYVSQAIPDANTSTERTLQRNSTTVTVRVRKYMRTAFMRVVGINRVFLMADATATFRASGRAPRLEIALALDTTGSMASEGRIDALKAAAKDLVDKVMNAETERGTPNVSVGVVPFSTHVNLGATLRGADWLADPHPSWNWSGCIYSQDEPYDYGAVADASKPVPLLYNNDCPPAPLMRLGQNQHDINATIDGLVPDGNTYIPQGLLWGWRLLAPDSPFHDGLRSANKVVVLMTDGANTTSDHGDANAKLLQVCAAVKQARVELYTIAFHIDTDYIKGLLTQCATSVTYYYDAQDNAALQTAFAKIAKDIVDRRLARLRLIR